MTRPEDYPIPAEERARQTLDKMAGALAEAVASVEPTNSAANPLEIFPEPCERRADTEFILEPDQEQAFREAMAKLGPGRETNLGATEAGLKSGYTAIIEGGQAHKMVAELNTVLSDQEQPYFIIIAATPDRAIPNPETDKVKEREVTAKVLGIELDEVGATEYDVARQVVEKILGFKPATPNTPGLTYDMDGNVSYDHDDEGGQFTRIGFLHNCPVVLMRIDRDYAPDGKSYKTLGSHGLMKAVDGYLEHWDLRSDIGFVTSATYQPSREVDAASLMLELEHNQTPKNIAVITYGTHELAAVKGEHPTPPPIEQIGGEAHKAFVQLNILRQLLESTPEQ